MVECMIWVEVFHSDMTNISFKKNPDIFIGVFFILYIVKNKLYPMKLLSNYDNYINELKLIESLRTFPLFLSKRLRKVLQTIDHDIARELLSKHSDMDTRVKQTFLDINPDNADTFTFINPNKAIDVLGWDIKDDEELNDLEQNFDVSKLKRLQDRNRLYKDFRSPTRIGRFINGAFPGQFQQSLPGGQNKKDIESFANLYKSLYNRDSKFSLLEVLDGDDIAKWYNYHRYDQQTGTLGDSCMKRHDEDIFDIYTSNPDKVSIIILHAKDDKTRIVARAILWTLDDPSGRKFMDRVYTNNYTDEQIFIDYAKENGWLCKSQQSMGANVTILDTVSNNISHLTLMSTLRNGDYDRYPYCDTMCYYNPVTGQISNKENEFNAKYDLTDTDGGKYNLDSHEEEPVYVFSHYHGEDINQNNARHCIFGNDYVRTDEAIRVWNSGGGENYAVPGNKDIVHSQFRYITEDGQEKDYNKWFPKEKCVWSDYLDSWVFKWSKVFAWLDLERKKSAMFHKKQEGLKYDLLDGEYWHIDLIDENGLIGEVPAKLKRPIGEVPRGWHRRLEFIDEDNNLWVKGKYMGKAKDE